MSERVPLTRDWRHRPNPIAREEEAEPSAGPRQGGLGKATLTDARLGERQRSGGWLAPAQRIKRQASAWRQPKTRVKDRAGKRWENTGGAAVTTRKAWKAWDAEYRQAVRP